ncbi:MAG TPA: cysteine--tRNA ligase [Terriglobia bacterium]|nr:cysteine--tRNA ligase [Terriglobia bacterium]
MALRLHNTLSGRVEEFLPLENNLVRIYTCGPTVYNYGHIGNYRTFVFQDVLRRHLKYRGYQVMQVMNLTDVDDKTIRNAREAGLPLREYTGRFIEAFKVDRKLLNLDDVEFLVRATDHIPEMVELVQTLERKGYAYSSDGSIYFKVDSFAGYGKLSHINLAGNRAGARVDADEYEKADVRDFVLWKAAKEGEDSWETPIGRGRPGWHLECSVMAMKYLGPTLDIHSGGTDLIFPHHENEIAQSEAATGRPFSHFWVHSAHLIVNGQKMSKSLGNFYTLRDLIARRYKPSAVRYLLMSVPYGKPLNFTFDGLKQAEQSLDRLRNFRERLTAEEFAAGSNPDLAVRAAAARAGFEEALDDDLNTAAALGAIFDLVREGNIAMDRGEFREGERGPYLDVLERWDRVFAVLDDEDYARMRQFGFIQTGVPADGSAAPAGTPGEGAVEAGGAAPVLVETLTEAEIEERLNARERARRSGEYAEADDIRNDLLKAGIVIEDSKTGTRWKRK